MTDELASGDAEHAAALTWVRSFLSGRGVPEEEIDRAEADDTLDLLVADRIFVPGGSRYTLAEVSQRTGITVELAERLWRALGFADVGPDEREFTDFDIEAIMIFRSMVEMGVAEVEPAVQFARVLGSAMARIAEAEISPVITAGNRVIGTARSGGDSVIEAARFVRMADATVPAMVRVLEFAWRRHVQAATRRAMLLRTRGDKSALPRLVVGFADMVGFTVLSQHLSDEELAAVVSRFEEVAHDIVTGGRGRIVKMIGDEVMFVTESVFDAARIGLNLAEAYADDELLSDVRVGMSVGPVLIQDGDYFGPVVNMASRLVNIGEPGAVLVSDDFHDELEQELPREEDQDGEGDHAEDEMGEQEVVFVALRPRVLKDFGRVQLWALYRPGDDQVRLDRRIGRRWERLAEVIRDLEELRLKGERLFSGAQRAETDTDGSRVAESNGGDAERAEAEGAVDRAERTSSEVDEPT